MPEYNLKLREKLLSDIAEQLPKMNRDRVCGIRVRLYDNENLLVKEILGLDVALHIIVNDLYWDDEGNWADADHAEIDTY